MPLPEKAYEYLDEAVLAIKPNFGFIHYYDFVYARKGEKPIDKVVEKVGRKMAKIVRRYEISSSRVVRTVGPNWHQIVLDIKVFI